MVEHETKLVVIVSNLHTGMITGFHMVASTMSNDRWYDSDATIHACNNKNYLKKYRVAEDGHKVLIENYNAAKVMRK
jgi:hypothetical protein